MPSDANAQERRLPVTIPHDTDPLSRLDPDWQSVPIGTAVIASDGQTISTVDGRRAEGLHVKGETPEGENTGEDYMVAPADITRVNRDGVHLVVTPAQTMRARPETTERDG